MKRYRIGVSHELLARVLGLPDGWSAFPAESGHRTYATLVVRETDGATTGYYEPPIDATIVYTELPEDRESLRVQIRDMADNILVDFGERRLFSGATLAEKPTA